MYSREYVFCKGDAGFTGVLSEVRMKSKVMGAVFSGDICFYAVQVVRWGGAELHGIAGPGCGGRV